MAIRDCEVAVVGGGVAGCTAALYCRRYGLDCLVLERQMPGGRAATAALIENYPGFPDGISGPELAMRIHEQAAKQGVEFTTAEVMGISRAADGRWILHTDQGDMTAIAIIVAIGAQARKLNVPGEEEFLGRGVSYCATCDGFFFRGKIVAVVGGGNTAIEEALYLADLASKVYVIHRRDQLRAEKYLQDQIFKRDNVEFVWNSMVVEITGDEEGVKAIRVRDVNTKQDRVIEVDGVFVAIGYEPKTDWLAQHVKLDGGFIVTNELMQTSAPGVFAAGDVRVTPVRQITTAVGDATIAAYSAYLYVQEFREGRTPAWRGPGDC